MFIKSKQADWEYRQGRIISNNPINVSLIASFSRARLAWYPDNEGRPAIQFYNSAGEKMAFWSYQYESGFQADWVMLMELKLLEVNA